MQKICILIHTSHLDRFCAFAFHT